MNDAEQWRPARTVMLATKKDEVDLCKFDSSNIRLTTERKD